MAVWMRGGAPHVVEMQVTTCWSSPLLCLGTVSPKQELSSREGGGIFHIVLNGCGHFFPKMHVYPVCSLVTQGPPVLVERPAGKSLIFHGPPHPVFLQSFSRPQGPALPLHVENITLSGFLISTPACSTKTQGIGDKTRPKQKRKISNKI